MKILHLTDIHGRTDRLSGISAYLKNSDAVVISGDITHFGTAGSAAEAINLIRGCNPNVFAVAGNCDPVEMDEYLDEEGISLNGECRIFRGIAFFGITAFTKVPCVASGVHSEDHYSQLLEKAVAVASASGMPMIMVSHQPPYGTVNDKVLSGAHAGNKAVRAAIEKCQPAFCLTGHIHEGKGTDTIGGTIIVNPGPFKEGYFALIDTLTGQVALF